MTCSIAYLGVLHEVGSKKAHAVSFPRMTFQGNSGGGKDILKKNSF